MRRVLLIDDEAGIRFALRRFFERAEWSVAEAADGVAALESLRNEAFDLVLLDLNLPGVSGSQILTRLRTEHPALVERVLLTTGNAVIDAEPDSVLATHPHVLQKPFDLTGLKGKIRELLGDA